MDEPLFKITESKTAGAVRWSKRAIRAEARVTVLYGSCVHACDVAKAMGRPPDDGVEDPTKAIDWIAARTAQLEELVEEWQAAAGIGVDSDGITPAMAEAHWGKLEAKVREAEASLRIECPCCGQSAADWFVNDGDSLLCGCDGQISCCSETRPYANAFDCECGGDGYPGREESKPEAENQPVREEGDVSCCSLDVPHSHSPSGHVRLNYDRIEAEQSERED